MSMLRSWEMKFILDPAANDSSLYLKITQMIIAEIMNGRLKPLAVMPGSRELATILKVNRKTVVLSYNELIDQGWLVTENRRGTFVTETLPLHNLNSAEGRHKLVEMNVESNSIDTPLDKILPALIHLNLSDVTTDVRLLPYEIFSRSYRRALVTSTRQNLLKPSDARGNLNLRESIADMLNMEKGFKLTHENICLVSGIQMGIFVAARVITNPKACIIFENLTYQSTRETFKSCGASIMDVGIDEDGILVDEIEKICKVQLIQAVFVTLMHQFPTQVKLSAERRAKLLWLANRYDFIIIENDHNFEYNFSTTPIFPISSQDTNGKSLYIGSLTGSLAPGFNIGYMVANTSIINSCAHELSMIDSQRNIAQEISLSELIKSGEIKRHMRRMTKVYRDRRDCFKDLLHDELKDWISFTLPENGLAFWIKIQNDMYITDLIIEAKTQGLHFEVTPYISDDLNSEAIRVGFAPLNNAEMKEAVKRLKSAIINVIFKKSQLTAI
jgi:GntR family transcriptional regulator/MocR family aminotransferase